MFFTNSGAEANEAALKLTRRTGRTHLVAAEGAFHGRTMGALALTAKAAYREPFEPLPGRRHLRPVRRRRGAGRGRHRRDGGRGPRADPGRGRRRRPADGYLADARAITPRARRPAVARRGADRHRADRTRGSRRRPTPEVAPDVVTVAKGLGGGIPIGACLGLGAAADLLQPGNHGTTFGGNPVACAAALAVLDTIEHDDLLARARDLGQRLRDGLAEDPRVTEVRGRGLLIGLDVTGRRAVGRARPPAPTGSSSTRPDPDTVRLAPPLVLGDDDVDAFRAAWPAILDDAARTGARA